MTTSTIQQPWRFPSNKTLAFWAGPLCFVLLTFVFPLDPTQTKLNVAAGVAVWMAIWWVMEALPLAVTALLPLVLFPPLGILSSSNISPLYSNSIIFLFMGGFILAIAMERWNLHKRLALHLIALAGLQPKRLILGFMVATAFLSMWISNTASTMMLVPIAMALIDQLEATMDPQTLPALKQYATGLLLAIAYSASIGGMATLIGTPPNIVFAEIYHSQFPNTPPMAFSQWLLIGLPVALVLIGLCWAYLVWRFSNVPVEHFTSAKRVFDEQFAALGKMTRQEWSVLGVFIGAALLWLTRSDIHLGSLALQGWGDWFNITNPDGSVTSMVSDGTIAMVAAVMLFLMPSGCVENGPCDKIVRWQDMMRFPWHILILFGGGFALAEGVRSSGLAEFIANAVVQQQHLPFGVFVTLTCTMMNALTEFTSNIATTQMVLPILGSIAEKLNIAPLLIMIPATLSASCAFMLPVATAPNAIIFGTNRIKVSDMAKTGFILNVVSIAVIVALTVLIGPWLLN